MCYVAGDRFWYSAIRHDDLPGGAPASGTVHWVRVTREQLSIRLAGGRRVTGLSFLADPHEHRQWELTLIRRGAGTRLVGDQLHQFGPGDLVLLPPGLPHTWASAPSAANGVEAGVVHFTVPVVALAEQTADPRSSPSIFPAAEHGAFWNHPPARVESVMMRMADMVDDSPSALAEVFALIAALSHTAPTPLRARIGRPTDPSIQRRLDAVCDYVLTQHPFEITVAEAARLAAMTPNAFSRFFRAAMRRSFTDYVTEVRLSTAGTLLRDTDFPISTVATHAGYRNLANFNRRFRQHHGMTPRAYRTVHAQHLSPAIDHVS